MTVEWRHEKCARGNGRFFFSREKAAVMDHRHWSTVPKPFTVTNGESSERAMVKGRRKGSI